MTKEEVLKIFNKLEERAKAFFFSKDIIAFLFFLIVSALFWVIMSLNKTSDSYFGVNIKYINIPQDIEFSAELPSSISIKLKDRGIVLWTLFQNPQDSLVFDFEKHPEIHNNGKITIRTATEFEGQIKERIPNSTTILDYEPNFITIEKGALKSKKVVVSLVRDITCDDQFCFSDSASISPKKITIFAPVDIIDNIDTIYTEVLRARDLTDTLVQKVKVVMPNRCKTDKPTVEVTVPVEIYIEGFIMVPVKVNNVPPHYNVKTIPSEVSVKYNIGKSKFGTVKPSSFQLYIDYNDIIGSNSKRQYITVGRSPSSVINYKLSPESVEYVVQ